MNKIVLGHTGQTLKHIPMGVASSVTYVLEDLTYGLTQAERTVASGSATVASWSLTTNAVAGPTQSNGRRIGVTATTGASLYAPAVIAAHDGTRELFEVAALSSGSYVEAASSLAGVYPSGSTVSGVLISASCPDDFDAVSRLGLTGEELFKQQRTFRVTWTYTLDGIKRRVPEFVHFVRHSVAADELVGEAVLWIADTFPDARERIPDNLQFDRMARRMAEEVADDIRARERDPETFLIGTRGRNLVAARILAHLAEHGWSPGDFEGDYFKEARTRYERRLEQVTVGLPGRATAETDLREDTSPGTPSDVLKQPLSLGW